jgi:small subunit ribosomal protein S12
MLSTGRMVGAHIPGVGHTLKKYSAVLVAGHRVRDLPGVKFRTIRGVYDLKGIMTRFNARSKYGAKKQSR